MKTLSEVLADAEKNKVAVGHFNISDLAALNAIFAAAKELNVAVMVGVSEGEREFVGVHRAAALVQSLREQYNFPIFLNADHTHSLDKVREAALAGYDEILFDGSKLSFEENVRATREAVKIVKSINPNILVEGEIGYIGSSSEIMKEKPEGIELTTPEEAAQFVKETAVDILAPAVGNMHGLLESMVKGDVQKRLDIERIRQIKDIVKIPLTLHGGSGTAEKDFLAAIKAGITIIHINTEIRIAWRKGVEEGLAKNPNEIAPYKILPSAVLGIKEIVRKRLELFNSK
ncbi:MAG: class II fructose-bisphosphate aldolase [bacterium]|nr:class II fructose-bisphosphate aldolase [bacterium]